MLWKWISLFLWGIVGLSKGIDELRYVSDIHMTSYLWMQLYAARRNFFEKLCVPYVFFHQLSNDSRQKNLGKSQSWVQA